MLLRLYRILRAKGVPVTLGEHLDLMAGMRQELHGYTVEGLFSLGMAVLVKQEKHLEAYTVGFAEYAAGLEALPPEALAQALTGLDDLPPDQAAELQELLAPSETPQAVEEGTTNSHQQAGKGKGGAGIGERTENAQEGSAGKGSGGRSRQAGRWNGSDLKQLRDDQLLGARNLQVALRQLRRLTREGRALELDLPGTLRATARQGGLLDIRLRPPRKNHLRLLLFLDNGGSMDAHARVASQLFSAARHTFKRLEVFYFHNFIYEGVWKRENGHAKAVTLPELMRQFDRRHRVLIVGDASMNPFELVDAADARAHERLEAQPGVKWFVRLMRHYPLAVWLNPEPVQYWEGTATIRWIRALVQNRMYPLTPEGLREAVRELKKPRV